MKGTTMSAPDARAAPSASRSSGVAWAIGRDTQSVPTRCVSLPFTSPALIATRVRATSTGELEMLLSNPGGGKGVYVAHWAALRGYVAPSLHDIMLVDRVSVDIAAAGSPSPASIRRAAFDVAAEGHCGRRVAQAARRAREAERDGTGRIRAHLLLSLSHALGLTDAAAAAADPWTTRAHDHEAWLSEAPRLLAKRLDGTPPWLPAELSNAIARIAALVWPLGVGPCAADARLPRVLGLLRASSRERRSIVNLDRAVGVRVAEAEAALHQARALLDDPIALLTDWRLDQGDLLRRLEQPDWLLDGWDRLCLLCGDDKEGMALAQMLLHEGEQRMTLTRTELDAARPPGLSNAAIAMERQVRNEKMRLRELQLNDPGSGNADG